MTGDPALRRVGGLGSGATGRQPDTLADVLERVLDKGIVIVGDVVVNLLDIELLTIKLRLFVASAETAREMGLDFWTRDPYFSGRRDGAGGTALEDDREGGDDGDGGAELRALRARVTELEDLVRRAGLEGAGSDRPGRAEVTRG